MRRRNKMSNRKIYRQIAKKNGVTVAEVKGDMQSALKHAYESSNNNIVKAYQNQVRIKMMYLHQMNLYDMQ